MQVLVTGAAGFIGSTLTERLLASGHAVLGVDALTSSYDPARKRRNLVAALAHEAFAFVEADLTRMDLAGLVRDVDVVFHASIHHVQLCAPFEFWSCVRRSALVQIPFVQFA